MKKAILLFILVVITISSIGCDDREPTSWNPLGDHWEHKQNGTIKDKFSEKDGNNNETYYLLFDTGKKFKIGQMKDFDKIEIGQKGILYKNNLGWDDTLSWFMWILDENEKITTPNIPKKEIERISTKIIKIINKYEWKKVDNTENLKNNNLVLIRLDDSTIAVGFITHEKKWKLNLNKNKYKCGRTLTNVVEWKEIDLE